MRPNLNEGKENFLVKFKIAKSSHDVNAVNVNNYLDFLELKYRHFM